MHASDVTPEVAAKANGLYWTSDDSVNQIADRLELSKGALYAAIEPLGSGLGCPLCGDEVGYANRTARDRKQLACSTCDWDGSPDETISMATSDEDSVETRRRERTPPIRPLADSRPRATGDDGASDAPVAVPPRPVIVPPMSTIAKGALIGGAVGLALVLLTRRR